MFSSSRSRMALEGCETNTKIRINSVRRDLPHVTIAIGWYWSKKDKVRQLNYRQTPTLNENEVSSRIEVGKGESIKIVQRHEAIGSVAFVTDGDYIVGGGGGGGMIRRWRVKDGKEVGRPIDAGSEVRSIAVSRDGKWIVGGLESSRVTMWDARSHRKAIEFKGG